MDMAIQATDKALFYAGVVGAIGLVLTSTEYLPEEPRRWIHSTVVQMDAGLCILKALLSTGQVLVPIVQRRIQNAALPAAAQGIEMVVDRAGQFLRRRWSVSTAGIIASALLAIAFGQLANYVGCDYRTSALAGLAGGLAALGAASSEVVAQAAPAAAAPAPAPAAAAGPRPAPAPAGPARAGLGPARVEVLP
jgi:hypothetical protein